MLDVARNTILMGEEKTMRLVELVCVVLIGLFLMTPTSFAEEQSIRTGFWGGIDFGVGLLKQSLDEIEDDDTTFFLGFKAGYTINPHFRMGLELSGWLLEESNLEDPSVGEGINQIFLIARYYPRQKSNLFAKVGGGYVSIWNNRPGEPRRKNGWGLTVGGGYDFLLNKKVALSPFVTYSFGDAEDLDYMAINLGVGIIFQQ
ncbi:MAG: outer membrane beta-barrel protein [Candidatus Hodarchaeales archaeon]